MKSTVAALGAACLLLLGLFTVPGQGQAGSPENERAHGAAVAAFTAYARSGGPGAGPEARARLALALAGIVARHPNTPLALTIASWGRIGGLDLAAFFGGLDPETCAAIAVLGGAETGPWRCPPAPAAAAASEPRAPKVAMVNVVVAKDRIPYGTRIERRMLGWRPWPSTAIPDGALSDPDALFGSSEAPVALRQIEPGEPVLGHDLAARELTLEVTPGLRAFTATSHALQSGALQPGDRADLYLLRSEGAATTRTAVLKGQRVVRVAPPSGGTTAVTLEMEPRDAQKASLAATIGRFEVVPAHWPMPEGPVTDPSQD